MIHGSQSDAAITCVVVDDHPSIAELVSRYLDDQGITVVGHASRGDRAITLIEQTQPRIAILDIQMPNNGGIEIAGSVARTAPQTAVIFYTALGTTANVIAAIDLGALGFVQKSAPLEELTRAVRTVADGRAYIDPVLWFEAGHRRDPREVEGLSKRERDVIRLLAEGLRSAEIGHRLFISHNTVRAHIYNAMHKLGANTQAQAVAIALRRSLIT